ncbi:MAG: hypothetical protein KA216_01525 [Giesbergeria sp.]|nr:hypothetical protein [Giesbergeria sp.]
MTAHTLSQWMAAALAVWCCAAPAWAQAPGEDPVILGKKLIIQMMPTGQAPTSGNIDPMTGMPSWLRARVARYEAKAFSADTAGILTNNDVVTTANAEGMQKTCVQEVGSNTLSGSSASTLRYGPNQAPQVVVLRGDLVNICR